MTMTVSLEEAASHLPELLSRLNNDTEEIVIARDGTPVARLLPAREGDTPRAEPRTPGEDAGRFHLPPEFFDPLPDEILDTFYSDSAKP